MHLNFNGANVGNEFALVSLLETALKDSLGDRYLVNTDLPERSSEGSAYDRPDLIIWPQDEPKRPYMVELKMIDKNFDLPLTVANQTKRMIEKNRELNPMLILATTSRVGNLLRRELDGQNVAIVQSDMSSDLADDITEFIRMNQTDI
jgi:hypothetical protein